MAQGQASCGCFGKVTVRPWSAAFVDAGAILALLICQVQERAHSPAGQWMRWSIVGVALITVSALLGQPLLAPMRALAMNWKNPQEAITDAQLLDQILGGWNQNRAHLNTMTFETDQVVHSIPTMMTFVTREGQKVRQFSEERTTRTAARYIYRGDKLRYDYVSRDDMDFGQFVVVKDGMYVKYSPRLKQAWLSRGSLDDGLADPIDLRCAGFLPPISDLEGWIKSSDIQSVQRVTTLLGREVARLTAKWHYAKSGYYTVQADFDPAIGFLPIAVTYRYGHDGTIASVSQIEYQKLALVGGWFLHRKSTQNYLAGAASDLGSAIPNLTCELTVRGSPEVRGRISDDTFDPVLPPKTTLVGDLMAAGITPNEPVPSSRMTRQIPLVPTRAPATASASSEPGPTWLYALAVDAVLLGGCCIFRRYLSF
jgi:hypothetical protein